MKNISAQNILAKSFSLYKLGWPGGFYISTGSIVLPILVFYYYFSFQANSTVAFLRQETLKLLAFSGNLLPSPNLTLMNNFVLSFAFEYMFFLIVLWIFLIIGYFTLIHYFRLIKDGNVPNSLSKSFFKGIKTALPRGLMLSFLLLLLFLIGQFLIFPVIVLSFFTLMSPLILIENNDKYVVRSFWTSLTLRYAKNLKQGIWAVVFVFISLGIFFYALVILVGTGIDLLLSADGFLNISSDFFLLKPVLFPQSYLVMACDLIKILMISCLLVFLPCISIELFEAINSKISLSNRGQVSISDLS